MRKAFEIALVGMLVTWLVVMLLLWWAVPAPAQVNFPQCAPLEQQSDRLREFYAEEIIVSAGSGDELLLIFSSRGGETWTALVLRKDGMACFKADGANLSTAPMTTLEPPKVPPNDSGRSTDNNGSGGKT